MTVELENKANDSRSTIDPYKRIWVCKSGWEQTLTQGDTVLSYMGIGRVGDSKNCRTQGKYLEQTINWNK